jgi:hypothetical protein
MSNKHKRLVPSPGAVRTFLAYAKQKEVEAHKVKLAIAVPRSRASIAQFEDSLVGMWAPEDTIAPRIYGYRVDWARNKLVEMAREENCTHICFLDDDQSYQWDHIKRLLAHNLPVVNCVVQRRGLPHDPMAGYYDKEDGHAIPISLEQWRSGKLVDVEYMSTGGMLIDMDVFNHIDMRDNWWAFAFPYCREGGEDTFFCKLCWNAGIPIKVDTSFTSTHFKWTPVSPDMWEGWLKEHGEGSLLFESGDDALATPNKRKDADGIGSVS